MAPLVESAFERIIGLVADEIPRMRGSVNMQRCDEGTHIRALAGAMAPLLADIPRAERPVLATRLAARLGGVVSVFRFDPRFGSPTRSRLESPDVAPVLGRTVSRAVERFVAEHPKRRAHSSRARASPRVHRPTERGDDSQPGEKLSG